MYKTPTTLCLLASSLLLSGCAGYIRKNLTYFEESSEQTTGIDKHSSFPAVRRESFEMVNLVELIDPKGEAAKYNKAAGTSTSWGVKYDLALAQFREDASKTPGQKAVHRNSVQDRIMGVATSRCNVFKTYLRRQKTDVNFWLGSATTAAGVLGAVIPGVTASRNLAATAGLFSGLQAEYNADYYNNLAAHVIAQGIDIRQNRLQKNIIEERQKLSVDDYSMEAAIKDAVFFDGTCSTYVGLIEASDSIKETSNPGLPRAAEVMAAVRAMQEISQSNDFKVLTDSGRLQQLLKQAGPNTSPLVVMSAKKSTANDEVPNQLSLAALASQRIAQAIQSHSAQLGAAFSQEKNKLPEADRSALTGEEVGATFTQTLQTHVLLLPVDACVKAAITAGVGFNRASANALSAPTNSAKAIDAAEAVNQAATVAKKAASKVELLVLLAQQSTSATAQATLANIATSKGKTADVKAPADPGEEIKQLCPSA